MGELVKVNAKDSMGPEPSAVVGPAAVNATQLRSAKKSEAWASYCLFLYDSKMCTLNRIQKGW